MEKKDKMISGAAIVTPMYVAIMRIWFMADGEAFYLLSNPTNVGGEIPYTIEQMKRMLDDNFQNNWDVVAPDEWIPYVRALAEKRGRE